jgi:HAD superfamily hydrolase (TIGR01509 family)
MKNSQITLPRPTKAVLFDLDGVLIDSYQAWFRQFNDALRHFGYKPIREEVFRQHWGQSTEEDVRTFYPGRSLAEVRKYFADHYHEYTSYLKVNPDARAVLKQIRDMKMKLGCVTNSHRRIVQNMLKQTRIDKFFEVVVTADDAPKPKPAPDMLLKACRVLKISPTEAVFIGDTATDMKACRNAGCRFVGYKVDAKIAVRSLKELPELLASPILTDLS